MMGGVLSYLLSWVSTPVMDETPNPATGLSEKDRQLISDSWSLVADKQTIKQNGVELFVQLFRAHPYMQNFFKQFKGMTEAELRSTPKMKAHALGVMTMLTSYVDNTNDVDTLVALVQRMVQSHHDRKIFAADIKNLTDMFPAYMKLILGTKFTPEAEAAWKKLLTTHNAVVVQTEQEEKAARGTK